MQFVIAIGCAYLAVLLLLAVFQRKLLYQPGRHQHLAVERFPELSQLFPETRDIEISCDDRVTIRGWLLQHEPAATRPLILLFHGNAGDRSNRMGWYQMFSSLDVDVLAMDYHGYGDSGGNPSEASLKSDGAAAWHFATGELGYQPSRIFVMGISLGGAVAVDVAARESTRQPVGGLIVISSFSSMVDTSSYHYPWVPVSLLLRDRYPSAATIRSLQCPYLHLHGDQDQVVPMSLGEKLFAAAPAESRGIPRRWVTMRDTDHNDLLYNAAHVIRTELQEFIENCQGIRP
ncbi:MAG: alpha/beta hydrolase [Planctomycetaceae bacterium]|nr:alpha/beta hydrolase [Planctomycetaceae bacterium]